MAKKEVVKKDVAKKAPAKEAAAPPAATAKKTASPLLTVSDISEHLATRFDIPRSHAKAYLAETVAVMGKHLKKGNKVRISGLGIFQVKKRAARKGRNPNTGEAMKIKSSKRVAFTVARDLKATL